MYLITAQLKVSVTGARTHLPHIVWAVFQLLSRCCVAGQTISTYAGWAKSIPTTFKPSQG